MELTGCLKRNPVTLARGKKKIAIIRKRANLLFPFLLQYQSLLSSEDQNFLRRGLSVTNWSSTRRGEVQSGVDLLHLYSCCRKIQKKIQDPDLDEIISELYSAMIETRLRKDWIILKFRRPCIQPYVDEIERRIGKRINTSAWGPHVTVVRNERIPETTPENGNLYTVRIVGDIISRRKYFWLPIESQGLLEFRTNLGLNPQPTPNLHLTIGRRIER